MKPTGVIYDPSRKDVVQLKRTCTKIKFKEEFIKAMNDHKKLPTPEEFFANVK